MKGPFSVIILFSFAIAIVLLLVFSVKAVGVNFSQLKKPTEKSSAEKIITPPKAGDETEIILNESELTKMLGAENEYIESPTVSIDSDGVLLEGKAKVYFVKSDLKFRFIPEVADGVVNIKVLEAKAGIFNAPSAMTDKINPLINDYLKNNVSEKGTISNIFLEKDKIIMRMKGNAQ